MSRLEFHWIKWLRVLLWVYFTILFGRPVLQASLGDRFWWLFLLNTLSIYLFLPLPVILLAAFWVKQRETWLGTGLAVVMAVFSIGKYYIPINTFTPPAAGKTITVMTYNVLGFNEHPDKVVAAIRASGADVVTLQELNPAVAAAIHQDLHGEYPYQQLDPRETYYGMGVISRYPLELSSEKMPGTWIGIPQILTMNMDGQPVTIINAHPHATNLNQPAKIEWSIQEREKQARAILDFATSHPGPLLVPIDFNSTDQNVSYAIVTNTLTDAWRTAGRGLGYTFPGANSPGSSRLKIGNIPVPMWLVRIDFVFFSSHFQAVDARIGPWDGFSDHRPVVAQLILVNP